MSFRSRKPPEAPSLPQQQAAPELMDIIDEISGVQTITVTGPDGKKRRHTQRLPLTPQEQQTLDQAEKLINQAVNNIETLYQYDPSSVVDYQPFIQKFSDINDERMNELSQIGNFKDIAEKVEQFRVMNRDLSMREFDESQRMAEENLARRGLSRSTQASELRVAMAKEKSLLAQQLDVNAKNYGADLVNKQLATEMNIFGLNEEGRNSRLQEAEAGYNLERQKKEDIETTRQNSINENMNFLNVGQGIKNSDQEKSRLSLAANQNATALFGAQASNQNQRFSNEINRIKGQHTMNMDRYKSTPASFGKKVSDLGFATAGQYVGSKIGAKIPGLGT